MKAEILKKVSTRTIACLFLGSTSLASLRAVDSPRDKINEYIHSCPYIGLVAKDVTYGPITLKDCDLGDQGRVVIAQPGEVVSGTAKYEIDTEHMQSLHLHHIIVGIKDEQAQNCLTHAIGILDRKGKASFSLKAPTKPGVYEVRFDYQTALTCNDASKEWREDPPSSRATVGIIIVE